MHTFLAVISDLARFARESLFGVARLGALSPVEEMVSDHLVSSGEQRKVSSEVTKPARDEGLIGQPTAYVTTHLAKLFKRPVWAFDTVVTELPLATVVEVAAFQGRFAHVRFGAVEGWILKDDISPEERDVWPVLVDATIYEADHATTTQVRRLIQDEFFSAELYLPLQPQEFILMRLKKRRLGLPSTEARPRSVGGWHEIYKGKSGVRISLEPKTGAVLEGLTITTEPFLAFVTAVQVDGTITIESVGRYNDGEYRMEVLTPKEWRDTEPVFIQF